MFKIGSHYLSLADAASFEFIAPDVVRVQYSSGFTREYKGSTEEVEALRHSAVFDTETLQPLVGPAYVARFRKDIAEPLPFTSDQVEVMITEILKAGRAGK